MDPTVSPFPRWKRSLALLTTSRVIRSLAAGFLNLAFPYLILTQLHESVTVLGLLYAGGGFSTALLAFSLGRFGSRYHQRWGYFLALSLLPVACLLLSFPGNFVLVALGAALGGFSATGSLAGGGVGGAVQPFQTALVADLVPPLERTRWLSILAFVNGLSSALGALLVAVVPLGRLFPLGLVLSVAALGITIPVEIRQIRRGHRPTTGSRRVIRKFSATGILNGVSQGLITPFLVPFFVLVYHLPAGEMSLYAAASGVSATVALLFSPLLERHWGFVPSLSYTRGTGAVLAVLLPFLRIFPVSVAIYLALPALRVVALPTQTSAMMGMLPPEDRAEGSGANQATRVASAGGATAFSGWAVDNLALSVPFLGYAAAVFGNIFLYVHFFGWSKTPTGRDRPVPLP